MSNVYPHTPQTFAVVALSACVLYGADGGLAGLVRLCRFFLPLFLLTILFILAGSLPWGYLHNLLPFWGAGAGPMLGGAVSMTGLYAPPVLFLLVAAGQLSDRRRLWRTGAMAVGGATILFTLFIVVTLLAFPLPLGYSVTFRCPELARLVTGGRFFERIESVSILVGFFVTACHLAVTLHTAAAAYAGAFRMPTHRNAVMALVLLAAWRRSPAVAGTAWNSRIRPTSSSWPSTAVRTVTSWSRLK